MLDLLVGGTSFRHAAYRSKNTEARERTADGSREKHLSRVFLPYVHAHVAICVSACVRACVRALHPAPLRAAYAR